MDDCRTPAPYLGAVLESNDSRAVDEAFALSTRRRYVRAAQYFADRIFWISKVC